MRLVRGAGPLALVVGMLAVGFRVKPASLPAILLSLGVLWRGWRWVGGTLLTRSLGIGLGVMVGLLPALIAFGLVFDLRGALMPACLLALPVLLWDLFVRQPQKGRFARAREARRPMVEFAAEDEDEKPE
jgi:hypothetical protein